MPFVRGGSDLASDWRLNRRRDGARINRQLSAVSDIMHDGEWHTLPELREKLKARGIQADVAGISARVRDLRKQKFGGHIVNRRHINGGLWAYQLVEPPLAQAQAA